MKSRRIVLERNNPRMNDFPVSCSSSLLLCLRSHRYLRIQLSKLLFVDNLRVLIHRESIALNIKPIIKNSSSRLRALLFQIIHTNTQHRCVCVLDARFPLSITFFGTGNLITNGVACIPCSFLFLHRLIEHSCYIFRYGACRFVARWTLPI